MPIDPDDIARLLDEASTEEGARALRQQVQPLRGVRGVASGAVARIAADAWKKGGIALPADEDSLSTLFGQAWEDGLVAVGLLAAATPDRPDEALDVGMGWLDRVDDVLTADAIGWLVLGPAVLAGKADLREILSELRSRDHAAVRRAAVAMGLAMTTERLEGPSAAPLRERLGTKEVQFVDNALSDRLGLLADTFVRDEDPGVRKGLRRVLGAWAADDPDAALDWVRNVRGGSPKMLREEIEKAVRKAKRKRKPAEEADLG
jgi:hypothetical protein